METSFDINAHIRRMERASTEELAGLAQQLEDYLNSSTEGREARSQAFRQAVSRLRDRSSHELALVNELIGGTAVV